MFFDVCDAEGGLSREAVTRVGGVKGKVVEGESS
jgi:hypothetical protein